MAFTLCTSGAMIYKAGANANSSVVLSGSILTEFSNEVEGTIVAETRRTWVDNYSGLSTDIKRALADIASDLGAMKIISYDMSGFTSRLEAGTMLDVLRDNANQRMQTLKDFKSNSLHAP